MQPVWKGYFADPHVIRTSNGYFAYGTDSPDQPVLRQTGRIFPVLRSGDLRRWELVGGALNPLDAEHYWAPEVCESKGRYFMYYSAGGEEGEAQRLRVAISQRPEGPFIDQGKVLMPDEPFSIDASPFHDPRSGDWYLFFAKDFLDGDFPGTGCAVVKLSGDLMGIDGEPTTVLRAGAAWQAYERNRRWYERDWPVWYTVEGPFCVYRQERYWLFYSGGLWKGEDYGVGVAVSDHVLGPYVDARASEGPSVLRSRPGLRGPGHNSVVVGPDGRDYICFHAWDEGYTKRQMYIEPLVWTADGPRIPLSSGGEGL